MQEKRMESYIDLMILSYFKQTSSYSLKTLAENLGIPLVKLEKNIEMLIENKLLEYRENLLSLTFEGRVALQKDELEYYNYYENKIKAIEEMRRKAISCNEIYVPENFDKKVRR